MSSYVLSVLLAFAVFMGTTEAQVAKLCELQGGYDINTLRKPPYWEVAISNTSQCPGFVPNRDDNCTVYVSFCQTLPNDNTPAGSCRSVGLYEDTSVCMVIGNQTNDPRPIGNYNKTIEPFRALKPTADGRTGFAADFPGSLPLNNCSGNIVSTVELVCYPEANWTAVGTNVTQFVISAGFPPSEPCLFLIVMQYKGACVEAPVSPTPPPAPAPAPQLPIEVGWILIILLVCVVPVYIVGGLIVNAIRGKRTASELFPNFQFWKGFPYLLLDGLHFSLDLVTCYICSKRSSDPKYEQI